MSVCVCLCVCVCVRVSVVNSDFYIIDEVIVVHEKDEANIFAAEGK